MTQIGTKGLVVVAVAFLAMSGEAMAAKRSTKAKMQVSGVVNLNTASVAQLDLLPGVGEKAAKRILEHRTKTPFARAEELVNVKGFGKKRFEKLKPYLSVAGQTTIKASKAAPQLPADSKPESTAQGRTPQKH